MPPIRQGHVGDPPYRAPIPVAPDPYLVAWESIRRPRNWAVALALVVPMIGLELLALQGVLLAEHVGLATLVLGVATFLLARYLVRYATHRTFRCPRCRKPFFVRPWGSKGNGTDNCCEHCGIKVGTPKSATDDP